MKITAQSGRAGKVHIYADGEYAITTDERFWLESGIQSPSELSDEEWELLVERIGYRKALNKGADLLSRRAHSAAELKRKLLRTCDEQSAQKAVEKLTELGYLDDRAFAEELASHLFNTKNYSRANVRARLLEKGVSRSVADDVLEAFEVDPVESILRIINKSYAARLSAQGGEEKVTAALQRRGFSYRDIREALARFYNE